jgi:hypothetical protein
MDVFRLEDDLEHLERSASLGYLLGAFSHELNNHLTNLLLAADQAEANGNPSVVELMVNQAQKAGAVVARLQRLGVGNLSRGSDVVDLVELCQMLKEWLRRIGGEDIGEILIGDQEVVTIASRHNLLRAFCNLARVGGGEGAPSLVVSVGIEQSPRSVWAPAGEQIPMAAVRFRRGTPVERLNPSFKSLVDDFFAVDRGADEVSLMAAWEVVRKLRGRMELYGEEGGSDLEIVVKLPLTGPSA